MTQQQFTGREPNLHQQMWGLLPWYVNGTLNGRELTGVEAHVAHCPKCQREAQRWRDLAVTVHNAHEEVWRPSPAHFASVMAQIQATEASAVPPRNWWTRLTDFRGWLADTPRAIRWTLALQGALVVVLVVALAWQTPPSAPPLYQTLTRGGEKASARHARLRIVVAEDTTEKELRALLASINATIIYGPSSTGVYTVALSEKNPTPEALAHVLKVARAYPKVQLAEPVSIGSVP